LQQIDGACHAAVEGYCIRPHVPIRSLRALSLFARVLLAYLVQWLVWRGSGRKLWSNRWTRVHERSAQRLSAGFSELGGVFIKLGQVVSVLGTFLPEAYVHALEQLQDAVPPKPFAVIRERLTEAWGPDWSTRFESFEEKAIAAASLAQVHRATLRDGSVVAVKVLYPNIQRLVAADLWVLNCVLPVIHWIFGFRRAPTVLQQLGEMLDAEMDYTCERRNIERLRGILKDKPDVVIPRVVEAWCTNSVLVLSFEEGVKLSHVDALRQSNVDPEKVANTLVDAYLCMLLDHRVFHADPHPGNFLVRDGKLVMLDYGAVAEVSEALVSGLRKVILGGLARNAEQVLAGVEEMGFVAEGGDRELLRTIGKEYLHALASMRLTDLSRLDASQIRTLSGVDHLRGRLRKVTSSVRYPEGYFYLERTLALLFGVVGTLVPDKGLLGIAAPHASRALMRSYARQAQSGPSGHEADPP
jgi:predicted unusual protein kinase regulating ubiquinone biosynthesis (AarF/ABC1/UbiB family)